MSDTNKCDLSGVVTRLRPIPTKTGKPMAEILLRVHRDRFRVTAHGNLASHILAEATEGTRLAVSGSLSVSNWKDEATGEWRNSFAVTAWAAQIEGGEVVSYQRQNAGSATPKAREGSRLKIEPSPYTRTATHPTRAGEFQAGPNDPF